MLLPEKKEKVRELGWGWWATKPIFAVRILEAEPVPCARPGSSGVQGHMHQLPTLWPWSQTMVIAKVGREARLTELYTSCEKIALWLSSKAHIRNNLGCGLRGLPWRL